MSTQTVCAHHVDLAVLGTVVRVRLDDPHDRQAVEGAWELCLLPGGDRDIPDTRVVTLPATANERDRLRSLTNLTQNVTRAAIQAQAGRLLMFHAGAISDLRSGATVAYVAPGGTGKTTITKTLGHGHGYVTDETVAVTPEGDVVPYPKPLSVRSVDGKDEVRPTQLGLGPVSAAPWLAGLMVVRREPEHPGDPQVRTVGLLEAMTLVSPETSALADLPEPLTTLRRVLEAVGGLVQVTYREASQLEGLMREMLARRRL